MALSIDIVCGGRARTSPETELAFSYLDRARDAGRTLGFVSFRLKEVDERKPGAFASEGLIVALDEQGKSMSSLDFSRLLAKWRDAGEPLVTFLIGGSDGLPAAAKSRAKLTPAFGVQTWPHLLVRPMLSEQLYRAMTILSGHPYPRA